MTPFGARIREMRQQRGITLQDMAAALEVSPAYLSALEHGKRGRPNWPAGDAAARPFPGRRAHHRAGQLRHVSQAGNAGHGLAWQAHGGRTVQARSRGVRIRESPARWRGSRKSRKVRRRVSAWRTGRTGGPWPCRTSCARPRGCRGSGSHPSSERRAVPAHNGSGPWKCRGAQRRPGRTDRRP